MIEAGVPAAYVGRVREAGEKIITLYDKEEDAE